MYIHKYIYIYIHTHTLNIYIYIYIYIYLFIHIQKPSQGTFDVIRKRLWVAQTDVDRPGSGALYAEHGLREWGT